MAPMCRRAARSSSHVGVGPPEAATGRGSLPVYLGAPADDLVDACSRSQVGP
jgi:hypothetical protein